MSAAHESLFSFRVSGVDSGGRRNYTIPVEEMFVIEAESVGDALNELINRSGMWETVDMDENFTIEFVPQEDDPS